MRSSRSWIAVAFVAWACVASMAPPAAACANAMMEAEDPKLAALRDADKALEEDEPERAYAGVSAEFDGLSTLPPTVGDTPDEYHRNRALRIAALAIVRTDGRVATEPRAASLAWARGILAKMVELRDGPLQQTDWAEARENTEPDEARAALERLAERDIVATPSGYAVLARLRARDHDAKGHASALGRCEQMAPVATICQARGTPSFVDRARRLVARRWKLTLALGALGAVLAWLVSRRRAANALEVDAQCQSPAVTLHPK